MDQRYRQMGELPYGAAWSGRAWDGVPRLDSGTYEGGSSYLPLDPLLAALVQE